MGAIDLALQKVGIFTGGGENVFWIKPQNWLHSCENAYKMAGRRNKFRAGCGRERVGHWEGDLIICHRTRPILVLKERKSRYVIATKLSGKTAAETAGAIIDIFRRLNPEIRKSITFDNGGEFAKHKLIKKACKVSTWFCDAYASWQKGAVENTP